MTGEELRDVVEQRMSDETVAGRIACSLRGSEGVEQRNRDGRAFEVSWENKGDFWRCIITDQASSARLIQMDLHENQTTRTDVFEPCRVTLSWEEELLCVTRYLSARST